INIAIDSRYGRTALVATKHSPGHKSVLKSREMGQRDHHNAAVPNLATITKRSPPQACIYLDLRQLDFGTIKCNSSRRKRSIDE
ncbi:MAG: hypothetical protein ACE10C_03950, partial [Candidatus Binatia bacterium]